MEIGDKVRVRGTKDVGVIIDIVQERIYTSTNKMFCVVFFEDTRTTLKYGIEELTKNL